MLQFQTTKSNHLLSLSVACAFASAAFAEDATDDFASVYGDSELVSIATGSKQPLAAAPAVATVITEKDIRAMGVSELDDVLEAVPSFTIGRSQTGYMPQYVTRGIFSAENQQVLLLINGVPLTTVYGGNRGLSWGGMPVRNIERIEIIRGPGSAVYGADAFAGVINVITKDYETTKNEVGARVGSFNTKEAWWLQRGVWKDLKLAFNLDVSKTDGHREKVPSDLQSTFDGAFAPLFPLFGTAAASKAPGPVNLRKKSLETHLDARYKAMQLKLGFQGRFDMGTGGGVAYALDPLGKQKARRFIADWTYHYVGVNSPWDATLELSYLKLYDAGDFFLFPPGSLVFFPGVSPGPLPDFFPSGARGAPENFERHLRGGLSAFYTGFANHRVRLGIGGVSSKLKVKERKNFNATMTPLPGGFVDVSSDPTLVFVLPHARTDRFAFLQDEWSLAQHWDATIGIRGDWYNDFGRTINPRAALVWQTTDKIVTKLLYGRAFRAPSFGETYLINNPVAKGTSGLSPETIETMEFAGSFRPVDRFKMSANVFAYRMKKILRFTGSLPQEAKNTGRQWGHGLEAEFEWKATNTLKLLGNYAFQRSTDRATRKDAGNAPHHQGYLRGEWEFKPKWMAAVQSNLIGRRFRVAGDTRPNLGGFGTVDMNIRYGSRKDQWSAGVIVQNIFDRLGKVPVVSPGNIPGDLPLAGRAAFVEAEVRL